MKRTWKWLSLLLPMNKIIAFLILFPIVAVLSHGQHVNFSSWSNNYLQINSYYGNVSPDAFTLRFDGNGEIYIPNWKISVRLKQPILSSTGLSQFPAEKISLQPTATNGQAYPDPVPTIPQIGMPLNTPLAEIQEVFLVPQSNAPLYNQPIIPNGYYDLQIRFNLAVAGGSYLTLLEGNWTKYFVLLEFRAYDEYNNIIGIREHLYELQLAPLNDIPNEPEFSIQIIGSATNGLLDIITVQDYQNGKSISYPAGLSVSANTDYQMNVRSLQESFISSSGHTLPLGTVNLSLLPSYGQQGQTYPVTLSSSTQKIASGPSTNNTQLYYDIIYSTKPDDVILIEVPPQEYSTLLQYEITPQ